MSKRTFDAGIITKSKLPGVFRVLGATEELVLLSQQHPAYFVIAPTVAITVIDSDEIVYGR